MNKLEFNATLSIALLYIIRMLGLFMILPVLPLLVGDLATPLLIGVALGIYGLSQAILQIPLGMLSDKLGRKPVIALGLLVFVIGSLVAAYSNDIYGIILGRFLQGCGAISSTLLALVSDVTRVDNRAKAMAIVGMSIGASFAIALVLGPWINSLYGIEGIFLGTAAAGLLGICVLFLFIPNVKIKSNVSSQFRERMGALVKDSALMRLTFSVFALHFLLMASFLTFPTVMQSTGEIDAANHHWVYLSILLTTFFLMGPFMWLSDKKGLARQMMLAMVSLLILSALIMSKTVSYYPIMFSMVLFFMAFNLLEVILPALVSKIAPAGSRGAAMGIYSSAQFLGAFCGGVIGGYALGYGEISYVMYANIALCCLWLVLALGLPKMGNIKSLIYSLAPSDEACANSQLEALLSVEGVIEAVLVEADELVYLKVDSDILNEQALDELKRSYSLPITS